MKYFDQTNPNTVPVPLLGLPVEPRGRRTSVSFEVIIQSKFCQLELASIVAVLDTANDVQKHIRFTERICSDTPGLVANGNHLVLAEPLLDARSIKDCLVVVGGEVCDSHDWIKRVRAMQRHKRPVVLFSDAATEFVKVSPEAARSATTHWRDIPILNEIGDYSDLSVRLAEFGNGILTCAGRGHAMEVMFNLVGDFLTPHEKAEMASHLMMETIRDFHREQPHGQAQGNTFLEGPIQRAIQLMEDTIDDPMHTEEVADMVGVSIRHLERLFRNRLNSSPLKTYKLIRLKRARRLISETRLSLLEVALACGFSTTSSMSRAFRVSFGISPQQLRASRI